MQNFRRYSRAAGYFILLLVTGYTIVSTLPIPGAWRIFSVLSGSMEPAIATGSIVIIKPESSYETGDIVTFQRKTGTSENIEIVTHRIVEKERVDSADMFQTKGDANSTTDTPSVTQDAILGKVHHTIPLLGYVLTSLRTPIGLAILATIAILLIVGEDVAKTRKRKQDESE